MSNPKDKKEMVAWRTAELLSVDVKKRENLELAYSKSVNGYWASW